MDIYYATLKESSIRWRSAPQVLVAAAVLGSGVSGSVPLLTSYYAKGQMGARDAEIGRAHV